MSEQTFAPVDDPFALRLLTPWLVKQTSAVTGVVPDTVWLALTFTATTCALFVVYEWLRGPLRISAATSTLAVLLLAVTFGYTSYNYGNFWLVDPLTNLAYALALFAAFRGKLIMFTLVMLVGFLNKETVLLLAPLYPLLAWSRTGRVRDRQVWLGSAAVVFVAGCYLVFRTWAQARIGPHEVHLDADITDLARRALGSRAGREHLAVFGVLHFLWAIFAFGLVREHRRAGARSGLLIASVYMSACALLGRMQATTRSGSS